MAKVTAESWNGGICPDAAVNRARSDHIRMAVKPISVPRIFNLAPSTPDEASCQPPYLTAVT
jgi:hypothetical protein